MSSGIVQVINFIIIAGLIVGIAIIIRRLSSYLRDKHELTRRQLEESKSKQDHNKNNS